MKAKILVLPSKNMVLVHTYTVFNHINGVSSSPQYNESMKAWVYEFKILFTFLLH